MTKEVVKFLMDYDMSIFYYLGKSNIVADALRRMSMDSVANVKYEKKE